MFCSKCGAEMKPTDAFCLKCGTENRPAAPAQPFRGTIPASPNPAQPAQNPAPAAAYPAQNAASPAPNSAYRAAPAYPNPAPVPGYSTYPAAPAEKKKKKALPIILSAAVLALILTAILIGRCFGPKAAARRFMRAYSTMRAKKIVNLLPKDMIEKIEDYKDVDIDDYIDELEDELEDFDDELKDEFGDNYRISFKILDTEKIDGKDFRNLKEECEDYYGLDEDRITAAKTVYGLLKFKGSEGREYETNELTVVKYKGKWYVIEGIYF